MKHPGTPVLYDPSKPVAEGGLTFRARFGVEHNGQNLLAEGSYSVGSEIKDGYPEFTMAMLKKLGWDKDLTPKKRRPSTRSPATRPTGRSTSPAASSGSRSSTAARRSATPRPAPWCGPSRIRSRCTASRSTRRGAICCRNTPTYKDRKAWRLPTLVRVDPEERPLQAVPDHPHLRPSGRIRGRRRRVALQQVARRAAAGDVLRDQSARRQQARHQGRRQDLGALPGRRQGAGEAHWSPSGSPPASPSCRSTSAATGRARTCAASIPKGTDPYVLGEASNMDGTYGYDSVTQMQETKVTLCRIEAA